MESSAPSTPATAAAVTAASSQSTPSATPPINRAYAPSELSFNPDDYVVKASRVVDEYKGLSAVIMYHNKPLKIFIYGRRFRNIIPKPGDRAEKPHLNVRRCVEATEDNHNSPLEFEILSKWWIKMFPIFYAKFYAASATLTVQENSQKSRPFWVSGEGTRVAIEAMRREIETKAPDGVVPPDMTDKVFGKSGTMSPIGIATNLVPCLSLGEESPFRLMNLKLWEKRPFNGFGRGKPKAPEAPAATATPTTPGKPAPATVDVDVYTPDHTGNFQMKNTYTLEQLDAIVAHQLLIRVTISMGLYISLARIQGDYKLFTLNARPSVKEVYVFQPEEDTNAPTVDVASIKLSPEKLESLQAFRNRRAPGARDEDELTGIENQPDTMFGDSDSTLGR